MGKLDQAAPKEPKRVVKISDLIPKPREVEVSTGNFLVVNPLTLEQIVNLFWIYQEAFLSVYAAGQQEKPDYTTLLMTAPRMVADIIAKATGAEGQEEDLLRLPGTVQLTALTAIWEISVPDPKKLLESLSGVMESLRRLSKESQTTGTEDSPTIETENLNKPE